MCLLAKQMRSLAKKHCVTRNFLKKKENLTGFWLFLGVKYDLNLKTIKSHTLRSVENLQWFAVFGGCPTGLVSPVILSLGKRGKPFSTAQRRPGAKADPLPYIDIDLILISH